MTEIFTAPERLLLLDAAGAALSAGLLGAVLPGLPDYFAMPRMVLYSLAGVALALLLTDLIVYFFLRKHAVFWLRVVAVNNALYALVSLGLLIYYRAVLTVFDAIYFLGEIGVLLLLVNLEWKASRN